MKPPIPNLIAHTSEPKSNGLLITVIVVIVIAVVVFFIYRSNKNKNDSKTN